MNRARFLLPALIPLLLGIAGCNHDQVSSCPQGTARIEGRILWTEPVQARVEAEAANTLEYPHMTVTAPVDSTGRYSLELTPGTYVLLLDVPDARLWYGHGRALGLQSRAEFLHLQAGDRISADFFLGALDVSVSVPGCPDGEGATLALESATDPEHPLEHFSITGAVRVSGGRIETRFSGLPPRTYNIRYAARAGWIYLPGTWNSTGADTVRVPPGATASYRGQAPAPGRLSGRIAGGFTEIPPLGSFSMPRATLYAADSSRAASFVIDQGDGSYDLPVAAPGTYKIVLDLNGMERWVGGESWRTATPFTVAEGQTVEAGEERVGAILCRLEGPGSHLRRSAAAHVYDADGQPAGDSVRFFDPGYEPDTSYLFFYGIRPGTWYVKVWPFGQDETFSPTWYASADSFSRATPIVVPSEDHLVRITVRLREAGGVR